MFPSKTSFEVPYYAVIFTNELRSNINGYEEMATKMVELASLQNGFLGGDSVRKEYGITISYWKDLEAIKSWRQNFEHALAIKKGQSEWYKWYSLKVCKVEKDYFFES